MSTPQAEASQQPEAVVRVGRVWCTAFAVFALLGVVWAIASPVTASPDETVHAAKATALVRGQVLGTERVVSLNDPKLLNGVFTTYEVPAGYSALSALPACYAFRPTVTADCAPATPVDAGAPTPTEVYTGRYPPTYYALVGWPTLFLGPASALPVMRVLSGLISAALLATAVAAVVDLRGRRQMVLVGFVLAVPPSVLFIGSSINPSAIEVSSGVATWLSALALVSGSRPPSRSLVVRTAVSLACFVLARPLSPFLLVVLVGIVWLTAGSADRARALWADRFTRRTAIACVAVGIIAVAYVLATRAFNGAQGFPLVDKSKLDIAQISLTELPWRTRQLVGVFGWLDTPLNPAAVTLWLGAAAALLIGALVVGRARERLALLATVGALVVIPLAAEVAGGQQIGTVWQGRYSLPLAVGVPLVSGFVLDRSGRVPASVGRVVVTAAAALAGIVQFVALATSVRRYATGADHPLFEFLRTNVWQPSGGAWLFVAAAAGATLLYTGWVVWVGRRLEPA